MISVVIPLYNKAHTIVNTLQTVMNQTYSDFEVIIIDDGSTDNGVQLINENFNDSRIKIIKQKNAGVSAARNKGIEAATQEYISFLDADDEWMPSYLENVIKAIKKHSEAGLFITGRYEQNFITKHRSCNIPSKYDNKISLIDFFENPHVFVHISATTIKASIIKNKFNKWGHFIPGQKSNEDFTFLFKVAFYTPTVYIGFPLSVYNGAVQNQATSTMQNLTKLNDNILFHNKVIEEWRICNRKNKTFKIFIKYEFRHGLLQYLKSKDYQNIHYVFTNIKRDNIKLLSTKQERILYSNPKFNKISILYILLTKARWRMHGFPRVK